MIVLSHGLWNRLGADPALVGTDVRLNGRPYTVVGVMPPTFALNDPLGPPRRVDAYTTFELVLAETNPDMPGYSGLIRARAGAAAEEVHAAVAAVGRIIDAEHFGGRGLTLYPIGLTDDVVASARPALLVLAAAGFVLTLMLLVNLASVLLARNAQREHELAVSRALGADTTASCARRSSRARCSGWRAARAVSSPPSGAPEQSSRSRRSICRAATR